LRPVCGIAGKVSIQGAVSHRLVEAMCEMQTYRGPDSRGIHKSDGACLGIQRLRIIDLETGDQPIYNEDRTVAVILNGEIYNYRELRRDLERRGHRFSTRSDTEVIPHLYEERGADLVHDLNGMFAFAVWDEKQRRLLLARDRVGKKPLFYYQGDAWLSFASELRALLVDDEIPREIDPSSMACYLAYGYIPAPWSIWKDVRKLEPAHTLVWENGEPTLARYWRLDYSQKTNEHRREVEEELRRLIGAAVRRRMIADVPLGAFLSGGVDSSIVVAEMAAASSHPVNTFSIGFEQEEYNELPRARLIADRFGTDHREFMVKPDAIEILPRLVRQYGEPYADPSAIPSFYLAELTRRHVTVALNGDGGDESFAGYLRHVATALMAKADRLPPSFRRGIAAGARKLPDQPRSEGRVGRLRRLLASVDAERIDRYLRLISVFNLDDRDELLEPAFSDVIDPGRARSVISGPWSAASGSAALDVSLELDVRTYLPDDLMVKIDIATMAHSLEARSPFLDPTVMEFAASLRPDYKLRTGRKKWILRDAYRGIVPDKTLDGAKKGFTVPLADWLRSELGAYSREVLLDPAAIVRAYVRGDVIESLLEAHAAGRGDHSLKIWTLLILEFWHREFADPGRA
jgi:asparagine synthase (glutamine-hydrolysing)